MAMNDKNIYQIDPRINKRDKTAIMKSYKGDVGFCSVAVNLSGGFATGSLNGEIRLYKQVG